MLSSLNKSMISLFNAYLGVFDTFMVAHTHRQVSSFSKLTLEEHYHRHSQTRQQAESLQTGKECECEEEVRH